MIANLCTFSVNTGLCNKIEFEPKNKIMAIYITIKIGDPMYLSIPYIKCQIASYSKHL